MFPDALYCFHCFKTKILGEKEDMESSNNRIDWWRCENCGDPDYRNQSGRISFLCTICGSSLEMIGERGKQKMHFNEYDINISEGILACPCGKHADCTVDYSTHGVSGKLVKWSIHMCHTCFIRATCKVIQDGKGKTAFEPVPSIIPSAKFGFSYN